MATYENKCVQFLKLRIQARTCCRLLGDPMFIPIWDRLNALGAIVFIHPTISDMFALYLLFLENPHNISPTESHLS